MKQGSGLSKEAPAKLQTCIHKVFQILAFSGYISKVCPAKLLKGFHESASLALPSTAQTEGSRLRDAIKQFHCTHFYIVTFFLGNLVDHGVRLIFHYRFHWYLPLRSTVFHYVVHIPIMSFTSSGPTAQLSCKTHWRIVGPILCESALIFFNLFPTWSRYVYCINIFGRGMGMQSGLLIAASYVMEYWPYLRSIRDNFWLFDNMSMTWLEYALR